MILKKYVQRFFVLMSLIWWANVGSSQSDSLSVDLGVNVFRMLEGKRSAQLDPDVWNPYLISAGINVQSVTLRAGFGMHKENRTEEPSDANGQTVRDSSMSRSDFRIGAAWNINVSPRWILRAGLDFVSAKQNSEFRTEFINEDDAQVITTFSQSHSEKGFAPTLGFGWFITPRVYLSTETSFRITSFEAYERDESNLNTTRIQRDFSGEKRFFMAPTVLYINYRF
jgi:hypothetical protein